MPDPTIRAAAQEDIPLLARFDLLATQPPFERSFWYDVLEGTGTPPQVFLETMFACAASSWGRVEDFLVLEVDGVPVAGCAVFMPGDDPARAHPFDLGRLPEVADRLSWRQEAQDAFAAAYRAIWMDMAPFLAPQAPAIIETVAVLPGHRGHGLGARLMEAAKDRGRTLGVDAIGIMAIHGNHAASRLYGRHFEPWTTYHPACFGGAFPGLTKYRAELA